MNLFIAGVCAGTMIGLMSWQSPTTFNIIMFWCLAICVVLNVWIANRRRKKTESNDLPGRLALVDRHALIDLRVHREAWRTALIVTRGQAGVKPLEPNEHRSFWQHEIEVFDHTFAILVGEVRNHDR
jgi:hypothetical protein